jgi:hypothetical protein
VTGSGGAPDPGVPRGHSSPGPLAADDGLGARDPRLAGFARDGEWDACPPSAALAAALEGASGPGWRCPGASRYEMIGLLRRCRAGRVRAGLGMVDYLFDLLEYP